MGERVRAMVGGQDAEAELDGNYFGAVVSSTLARNLTRVFY